MGLEIVGARELTLRKGFVKRAVIAETGSNVSPFGDKWFVRSAASDVSADGHRPESAAVIALAARKNAVTILLAAFQVKLPRKFNRGFGRFRASGSKIDAPAIAKIRRSHRKQPRRKCFCRGCVKL